MTTLSLVGAFAELLKATVSFVLSLAPNNTPPSGRIFTFEHLPQFILELEMFQTKTVQNIKTHFGFNNGVVLFTKSCSSWDMW
jgi:hypothetical protein